MPYNKSFIHQACSLRWLDIGCDLFFMFIDLGCILVHKHTKRYRGQYPAILTSILVNNPFIKAYIGRQYLLSPTPLIPLPPNPPVLLISTLSQSRMLLVSLPVRLKELKITFCAICRCWALHQVTHPSPKFSTFIHHWLLSIKRYQEYIYLSYPNSKCPPGSPYCPLPEDPFLFPTITQFGCSGELTKTPIPTPTLRRTFLSAMFEVGAK